eukprot:TRINITY_DN26805_c0_g1_i4.p1 TRINITY_DN26805_c0_g1~~TRINITY_DN26805_c0_g1_i4.p1  ORF type:complete len:253 (+),score=18.41 TRINITY_DN26805_c0_g1_i4:80-838(+)
MDSDYELPVAADADWAAEHQRADGHTAQQAVHPQLWSRSIPPPVSLTLPPERPQRPAGMRPQEGRADRATLRPPDAIGMRRRFSLPEQRGVLHWLGTARGTQVYINPVVRGCVTVWLSSICRGDGAMLCDCHFNQQCLFTRDVPWSWATLYLHTASVRPTAYRLCHRAGPSGAYLRDWQLHGSWYVLSTHRNCADIREKHPQGCWTVQPPPPAAGLYFSYFRVLCEEGGNSDGGSALVISCMELYGDVECHG